MLWQRNSSCLTEPGEAGGVGAPTEGSALRIAKVVSGQAQVPGLAAWDYTQLLTVTSSVSSGNLLTSL